VTGVARSVQEIADSNLVSPKGEVPHMNRLETDHRLGLASNTQTQTERAVRLALLRRTCDGLIHHWSDQRVTRRCWVDAIYSERGNIHFISFDVRSEHRMVIGYFIPLPNAWHTRRENVGQHEHAVTTCDDVISTGSRLSFWLLRSVRHTTGSG
jgi:hypothetical protein